MRILVLNSGGVKSAFLLAYAAKEANFGDLFSLFINYGQPALKQERKASLRLANYYGAIVKERELYAPPNYIPFKQTLFYWQALLLGYQYRVEVVYIGASADDEIPEATEPYLNHIKALTERIQPLYLDDDVYQKRTELLAPLIKVTRQQVIDLGQDYRIPWQYTYSCDVGRTRQHCGKCKGCVCRCNSFRAVNIEDPRWVEFL